ncbi:hypothetical protein G5S35_17635 [Paraburkholderia tropica]|uniref:hypothetical protein n=1 Tax=Paraburkholderia tropica TaxID=92647 RepID=UPI001601D837|nr:hypothetical protein [Paraburkholderia tropica]QNB13451.1 hypothetical protein G5S35_17635 [Paraburkholderia tropica]
MKPIRLQVLMPTIGVYSIKGRSAIGNVEKLTETMVISLRRMEFEGVSTLPARRGAADRWRIRMVLRPRGRQQEVAGSVYGQR